MDIEPRDAGGEQWKCMGIILQIKLTKSVHDDAQKGPLSDSRGVIPSKVQFDPANIKLAEP